MVQVIFKVTDRIEDPDEHKLLIPGIEVEAYWTNLPLEDKNVIERYHHDHGIS